MGLRTLLQGPNSCVDLRDNGSGGKSCRLAVGGLPVRSHPGRVEVSLRPNPHQWVNKKHQLDSPLDSPFIVATPGLEPPTELFPVEHLSR